MYYKIRHSWQAFERKKKGNKLKRNRSFSRWKMNFHNVFFTSQRRRSWHPLKFLILFHSSPPQSLLNTINLVLIIPCNNRVLLCENALLIGLFQQPNFTVFYTNENGGDARCMQNLVGKPEGRRPLGRPRCRWEDNIKMNLREVGWGWGHSLDRSGSK